MHITEVEVKVDEEADGELCECYVTCIINSLNNLVAHMLCHLAHMCVCVCQKEEEEARREVWKRKNKNLT